MLDAGGGKEGRREGKNEEEIGGQRGWEEGGQGNDGDGEERSGSFTPQERGDSEQC